MGFLALIFALLIEQARPLPRGNPAHTMFDKAQHLFHVYTQTGEKRLAWFAWGMLMVGMAVICVFSDWLAQRLFPGAQFVLHVVVLYLTVGFRQFSHAFSEIQIALGANEVDSAKLVLEKWIRRADPDFNAPRGVGEKERAEVCRLAIANAMVDAHRYVLAPLLWYVLLPGFLGPVLYRCAEHLSRYWAGEEGRALSPAHAEFARKAYGIIDWVPARMSAAAFAVVGNFEDAVYCWRRALSNLPQDPVLAQKSLLLSSGSGALGYRIYDDVQARQWNQTEDTDPGNDEPFDWSGNVPDTTALRSAVGLVWRTVVLWIGMFGLLTVAGWLGRLP
jgi:adenosylcobinamide-phosphate synthase